MPKNRRQFDLEFKQALVDRVLSGRVSQSQACREHSLSTSVVNRWIQQSKAGGLRATPQAVSLREMELERENLKLKEKLAELYLQVEALKKVESWKQQKRSEASSTITSGSWAQLRKAAE
jgi:transposase-like protein